LEQKYRDQIMRDKKRPDELASDSGRRRRGNEVKEAVQSEDEKDEAKKKTGDDSSDFHISLVGFDLHYIDINIICVKIKMKWDGKEQFKCQTRPAFMSGSS